MPPHPAGRGPEPIKVAHYDRIARQWETVTGHHGGPFKREVLNAFLLDLMPPFPGLRILELGAGNGYFAPWAVRKRGGEAPARWAITDVSARLVEIARRDHFLEGAEYLVLDAARAYPFESGSFDLVLATMLFNEMPTPRLARALTSVRRVLIDGGALLATFLHPRFVRDLDRRGKLRPPGRGDRLPTLPGPKGLRLPVVPRSEEEIEGLLSRSGFRFTGHDLAAGARVLHDRPGLRHAGGIPVALVFDARKP